MLTLYRNESFNLEIPLILALQKLTKKQIKQITKKSTQKSKSDEGNEKKFILCKFCKNKITSTSNTIIVNGQHNHNFKNPKGIVFNIGCFSSARGCLNQGTPTLEFTWFSGFSWCFSLCSRCFTHMGWYFQGTGKSFYGLILDNLIEENPK